MKIYFVLLCIYSMQYLNFLVYALVYFNFLLMLWHILWTELLIDAHPSDLQIINICYTIPGAKYLNSIIRSRKWSLFIALR